MRWILRIFIALVVVWSGYWLAGKLVIERQAAAVLSQQAAAGRVAETSALYVRGWPNRWDLTAEDVDFADPAAGIGYQSAFVQVFAMTWKPWHLRLALPDTQTITLPDQSLTLTGSRLAASLRSAPDLRLPLIETGLSGQGIGLTSSQGWQIGLDDLLAVMRRTTDAAPSYALWAEAKGLRPDPRVAAALAAVTLPGLPPSDLPDVIDRLNLDATITLTTALDRDAGTTRPRLQTLLLRDLGLQWGAMTLHAKGELAPDDLGFAAGRIEVSVTQWDRLPPLLVAGGVIPERLAPTVANMLRALAQHGGDDAVATLPLVLKDGHMSFGPLPLGPAPMLVPPPA